MTARARLLCVAAIVLAGAIGVISSTQTWLVVTLAGRRARSSPVAGAAAVPVLAPLSLAVLALGGALSIVGLVLRYVFGVLTVAIALVLGVLTAQIAFAQPLDAAAPTVTDATGITGTGGDRRTRVGDRRDALADLHPARLGAAPRGRPVHDRDRARLARERPALPIRRRAAGRPRTIPPA